MPYTVKVLERSEQWEGQHGPMVSHYLTLVDTQGIETPHVQLRQKPTTSPPAVGQVLEGNIDQGARGLVFKKAFAQMGGGGRGRTTPEERRSIEMQSATRTSVDVVRLAVEAGAWKPSSVSETADAVVAVARKLYALAEEVAQ